jgi:hypothetical protein
LIAPAAAATGADTDSDADDEPAGLADATEDAGVDAAALTKVDADVDCGLAEAGWIWVAGGLCAGEGVEACELLLHAVTPKATTAMVATAATVLRGLDRMIAPNFGTRPRAAVPKANPPPVTAQ